MDLRLTVIEAPTAPTADYVAVDQVLVFDLAATTRISIGRGSDCDVSIASPHLARRHAVVTVERGAVWLKDLRTTNGTYVDGVRGLIDQVQVTAGPPTVMRIGDAVLTLAIVPGED